MSKKQEIFDVALHFFSNKGFTKTSVEEIAKNAGISKGGFYTYFPTKNELMLEMIEEYHLRLIEKATAIDHIPYKKGNLAPLIERELEAWIEFQTFFNVLFKEFHPQKDIEIFKKMERLSLTLKNNHREIFHRVYGSDLSAYFEDMILILEGIMKEILIYVSVNKYNIDTKKVSEWLASHMQAIVENIDNHPPLLEAEDTLSIEQLFSQTKQVIEQKQLNNQEKMIEALEKLEQTYLHTPDLIISEALLYYLSKEPTIKMNILKIERLWKQQGENSQ